MSFGSSTNDNSRLEWIFGITTIAAFFVAFCVGASKSLIEESSSFCRSLQALLAGKPIRILLISLTLHLVSAISFSNLIFESYDNKLLIAIRENNELQIICAFSTLVAFALCNFLAAGLQLCFAINITQASAFLGSLFILTTNSTINNNNNGLTINSAKQFLITWLAFPALSSLASLATYLTIQRTILARANVLKYALVSVPYFAGFATSLPFAILLSSIPQALGVRAASWLEVMFGGLVTAIVIIVFTATKTVPKLRALLLQRLIEMRAKNEINSREFASRSKCFVNHTFDSNETLAKLSQASELTLDKLSTSQASVDASKVRAQRTQASSICRSNPFYNASSSLQVDHKPTTPTTTATTNTTSILDSQQNNLIELKDFRQANTNLVQRQQPTTRELFQLDARDALRVDRLAADVVFVPLQLLAGCLACLASGANDALGAVVPLAIIINTICFYSQPTNAQLSVASASVNSLQQQQQQVTVANLPTRRLLIFVVGNMGVCIGFAMYSKKQPTTITTNSSSLIHQQQQLKSQQLDSMQEFAIDLGASLATLLAARLGFPVSFAHCKLVSLLAVAWLVWRASRSNSQSCVGKWQAAQQSSSQQLSKLSAQKCNAILSLTLNAAMPALLSSLVTFLVVRFLKQNSSSVELQISNLRQ